MKHVITSVLRFLGLIFMAASAMLVVGEVWQMVNALLHTQAFAIHLTPWLLALGVASFGALLWQTGRITETLDKIEDVGPALLELVRSKFAGLTGGTRASDPPKQPDDPTPPVVIATGREPKVQDDPEPGEA